MINGLWSHTLPFAAGGLTAAAGWGAGLLVRCDLSLSHWRTPLTCTVLAIGVYVALIQLDVTVRLASAGACAIIFGLSAAVLDWRHGQIADLHSAGAAIAGLVAAPELHPYATWTIALGGSVLAIAILSVANLLVRLRMGRSGLGSGDYGLAAAGGLWCGFGWVGPALLLAVAVTAVSAWLRRSDGEKRYPFAPGLVTGFAFATIAGGLAS